MFFDKKVKCLFKCDTCDTILSTEFEDPKELENLREDKILLECPCGGICCPLRD
jgi:hypothetical protein